MRSLEPRSPIALSPDGQWLAYVPKNASTKETICAGIFSSAGTFIEARGCDVWVTNTENGATEKLGSAGSSNWSPSWSPDGNKLAFYSDRDGHACLWTWNLNTHQFKKVSDEIARPHFNFQVARWTADSRKIIFKVLPEGVKLEDVPWMKKPDDDAKKEEDVLVLRNLASTKPSSSNTAGNGAAPPANISAANKSNSEQQPSRKLLNSTYSKTNIFSADLALADIDTGKIERLVTQTCPTNFWVSPDGENLAFIHKLGTRANTQTIIHELICLNLSNHTRKVLDSNIEQEYGESAGWAPDGKSIAYISNNSEGIAQLFVVRADGQAPPAKWTSDGLSMSVSKYDAPRWDSNSQSIYLIGSKNGLANSVWKASSKECKALATIPDTVIRQIASVNNGQAWVANNQYLILSTMSESNKNCGFYQLDLKTGRTSKLFEKPIFFNGSRFSLDVSKNGKTIAYHCQSVDEPGDIWVSTTDSNKQVLAPLKSTTKKITELNPQMKDVDFGKCRVLSYEKKNGEKLRAALLLPACYQEGKRYPMVVRVYGGLFLSQNANCFGLNQLGSGLDNMQVLASRGYAVLEPDISIGKGDPVNDIISSVVPAIDEAIKTGVTDPSRIGVMGHSYGGYSTLALITQTQRFRAAIACSGISDLISAYGTLNCGCLEWCEAGQGNMLGTPWQFRNRYIENSPIFSLDQVQTPLLLVHGSADATCPPAQSEEVFLGLRRLDREVEYAKYIGEEHAPDNWKFSNQVDYLKRSVDWFDRHLLQTRIGLK